jgi:hypothetical protein
MIEILIGIGVLYTAYKLTQVLDFNDKVINKGERNED